MPYTELIKNFERIRSYMNDFYIYGFRCREEFAQKSTRSYDNERRRIESYLGNYMSFSQSGKGKNIFISIDTKHIEKNPLYKAFNAKSFTDRDITLYFILMDILNKDGIQISFNEIIERIENEYLCHFQNPMVFDESTIRKKLKEYQEIGLIRQCKIEKKSYYLRDDDYDISEWMEAISFFSEEAQLGVIGSFIMDDFHYQNQHFSMKHHYIGYALESQVLLCAMLAIREKRSVDIKKWKPKQGEEHNIEVVPLKIFVSAQTGRQYLMGYQKSTKGIQAFRLDYITKIIPKEVYPNFASLRQHLNEVQQNIWGIRYNKGKGDLEYVEFTLRIGKKEEHILRRIEREKRCGIVECVGEDTYRFSAWVYDTTEMIPWIRTFIGRILKMNFSNRSVENAFKKDTQAMYQMYCGEGGDEDAFS